MHNLPKKDICGPLLVTYTIAVLNTEHNDRRFLSYDLSKGRYYWANQYRSAVVLITEDDAMLMIGNIKHGEYPKLLREKKNIDVSTITLLKTTITFECVEDTNKYPWSNEDEMRLALGGKEDEN